MEQAFRRQMLQAVSLASAGLLGAIPAKAAPGGHAADRPRDARASGDFADPAEPGPLVTNHDDTSMPNFKYALDAGHAKVTSGGWAREATVHQLPISEGIAGVHMYLNPGASRELHWHAIAAEWAYVLEGRCQTTVIDPDGSTETDNFEPGDVWYFPRGHGHSIQTIGDQPCHFILSFDNGNFSEHGTFSITDWFNTVPSDILAQNFGVPASTFANFPKGETYIMQGDIVPLDSEAANDISDHPSPNTHKFRLKHARPSRAFPGGTLRLVTQREFPISVSMAGALMNLEPGGLRELHWHPNANEWQYVIKGRMRVALFGSGGRARVEEFGPGEVAYIPRGYGHCIQAIGNDGCELVLTFDNGQYQEISITNWLGSVPKQLLANNFGRPESTFERFPTHEVVFQPRSA